jgi:hypothetical protein
MQIIKAQIIEQIDGFGRKWFSGECEAIAICTNIPELQGELVEFLGDTQQSVVDQIIFVLKSRGMTGKLRLI